MAKVRRLLARRDGDAVDDEPDALAYAQAEAAQLPMSLAEPPPRTSASRRRCAFIDGFSLHADTSVDAADRSALERLVRYLLRPLISVCFQLGKSISAQLQTATLLMRYYPRSKLAMKTLRMTANAYASIAYYDRAAEELEQYAAKYAGEKDASEALQDAITYRAALGDTAKRIDDTRTFVKTFGSKRSQDAAAAMFAVVSAFEAPDDAIKQLREFIDTFAKVDDELAIVAHARLGDLLWAKSCPVLAIDGLCVGIVRDKPTDQCGEDRVRKVVPVKCNATAAQALDEYKLAIALFEKAPRSATPRTTHAAAMAKLVLADVELEHMLLVHLPTDLDFDPAPSHKEAKQRSMKRFTAWIEAENREATAVTKQYTDSLTIKDVEASMGAVTRIGQTVEAFWRAMLVGEIPKAVKTGDFAKDKLAAYCGSMRSASEPLATRAAEAFALCLARSAELSGGQRWASICVREGHLVAPDKFPDTTELYAAPVATMPMVVESPMR